MKMVQYVMGKTYLMKLIVFVGDKFENREKNVAPMFMLLKLWR